jgi:hypothetical protein
MNIRTIVKRPVGEISVTPRAARVQGHAVLDNVLNCPVIATLSATDGVTLSNITMENLNGYQIRSSFQELRNEFSRNVSCHSVEEERARTIILTMGEVHMAHAAICSLRCQEVAHLN